MANKLIKKDNKFKAKIVNENQKPCAFCHRKIDDEINYGKLYAIGDIQCHYFCALLSCCLIQNGSDEVGLFGFLYLDILAELERCKKHRCSYCGQGGASIGCCVSTCRKQFHLPCGREKDAVSLFHGTFKSYCRIHAPKQKIPEHIMTKAKLRRKQETRVLKGPDKIGPAEKSGTVKTSEDMVCVICYEVVDGFPTLHTFWPPCCARDAWFHRSCLQRMALAAGMHYLKCPLCNDKDTFYDSVISQGYYVPDRDAAWELEQNAFSEIYERPVVCGADECLCPLGRKHDTENGPWDIKLCLLCGSVGRHSQCAPDMFVCETCKPVAPTNLEELATKIDKIIQQEQTQSANRRGPVMPSRMSLRRTKARAALLSRPSSSRINASWNQTESENTISSRLELNIKPPRKPRTPCKISPENDSFISPTKVINGLQQKGLNLDEKIVEKIRRKILKPRPLSVKRRVVNETLNKLLKDKSPLQEHKQKDPIKEWCSPKKHEIDNVEETQPPSHMSTPHKDSKTATPVKKENTPQKSPKNSEKEPILENMDDSSKSTFELPSEFVADVESDDSCHFETPKSKTVDIKQDSSMEIFKNNESVGIDVRKMENSSLVDKIFNFSPLHDCKTKNMDIENFKKEYLNEVDKKYKIKSENMDECTKHSTPQKEKTELSISDNSQIDLKKGGKKRRCQSETMENNIRKKRKISENGIILRYDASPVKVNYKNDDKIKKQKISENGIILRYDASPVKVNNKNDDKITKSTQLRKKKTKKNRSKKKLKLIIDSVENKTKNKKNKLKTKLSINNKNIKLKIKWKKEQVSFELESKTKKQKKIIKKEPSNLKQYVLQFPMQGSSKEVLLKPENDVTALKKKRMKLEKSPDNFKQTSLHSFFKVMNDK